MKSVMFVLFVIIFLVPTFMDSYAQSENPKDSKGFVIKHVEGFHEHSQYYDIKQGRIVNEIREDFIYPYDPLTYQITIENPLGFDRTVHYFLNIKQGDVSEQQDNFFYIPEHETRTYSIPFHLNTVGAYEIKLKILLDDDITPTERRILYNVDKFNEFFDGYTPINRALSPVLLDVKSPTYEILELTNQTLESTQEAQMYLVYVTIALVGATFIGMFFNTRSTNRTLNHMEGQLSAALELNENSRKQLLVSNFDVITNYIGNEKTRLARRIMYKHYKSKFMNEFSKNISKIEPDSDYDRFNEWAKYIGAIYNRVSFLLEQDSELNEKFKAYHGYTLGIIWKIFEEFNELWQNHYDTKSYSEFERIGKKFYGEWKGDIDKFLKKKEEQNKGRSTFDSIFAKKHPLE